MEYIFSDQKLPENLFNILASPNKEIYVRSLITLYKAFLSEWTIKKEDLIVMFIQDLENLFEFYETENEEEEEFITDRTSSGYAHFLVRRLRSCGWIEVDMAEDSFEEMITIPDYAHKFMKVLYEVSTDENEEEYNRYVFSTFSVLRTAETTKEEYMTAIDSAHSQTLELLEKLKVLLNNIKKYHRQLGVLHGVNDVLDEHFNDFKDTISDRIYYPIKTFDSVHRYKANILHMAKTWLYSDDIFDKIEEEAWRREQHKKSSNVYEVREKARQVATEKLVQTIDIYEKIDILLYDIDRKNTDYTRATIEKMEFLLNTDRSIKGKVRDIIKKINEEDDERYLYAVHQRIQMQAQEVIEEQSLYTGRKKPETKKFEREKLIETVNKGEVAIESSDFVNQLHSEFSKKKVQEYIYQLLEEKDSIKAEEIEIENDHDFVSTILGLMAHDDKGSKYKATFEKEGHVRKEKYEIPEFTIEKRKSVK